MASLLIQVICQDGVTKDGEPIRVERKVALVSKYLKAMIEWKADKDGPDKLHSHGIVDRKTLVKMLEWMEHHKDDIAGPLEEQGTADDITAWDKQFMNIPREDVYDILHASNYLDIPKLIELGAKTVVSMLRGKTPEELRDHFEVENNFDPDEEEKLRQSTDWTEEPHNTKRAIGYGARSHCYRP